MKTKKVEFYVFGIFIISYMMRFVEYFLIRTDQTLIGEAFIHKLLGIVLILLSLRIFGYEFKDIGLVRKGSIRYTIYGFILGILMFAIGYGVEIMMLVKRNIFLSIQIYPSSYAIEQNNIMETGSIFILICVLGNILNVIMEEGMFRGLFPKLLMDKGSFFKITTICSLLFGLWHIIGPIRNYMDGISSFEGMISNCLMLFFTSTLIAYKFAMLSKMEGALYMGMADHFVNNTIVNLLHVTSNTGIDELMVLRIAVAQSISFCFVLILFLIKQKNSVKSVVYE